MAANFFDISALVKRYHPEVGTADVNRLFSEQHSRHFIARLDVVEVQSALVRKVWEGLISLTDLDVVRQRFLDEITQRRLQVVRMTRSSLQLGATWFTLYSFSSGHVT